MRSDVLYIVIPCYNEEQVLPETSSRLERIMEDLISKERISSKSRVLLCDDGSKDRTWEIIEELHAKNELFSGVKASRNRGHQNVLYMGLMVAKDRCDMAISMDADLQDDPEVISEFISKYEEGCEIVYGVRSERTTDTSFKRNTAHAFYRIMNDLGTEVVYDHADFRLMSKRALEELSKFEEVNLFLRGMVTMIGFKTAVVKYERHERYAGESKYSLSKMMSLAIEGVTSFSVKPMRIVLFGGVGLAGFAFLAFLALIIVGLCGYWVDAAWICTSLLFILGGAIIACLGLVGLYAGSTLLEVKHRPRYIIDRILES